MRGSDYNIKLSVADGRLVQILRYSMIVELDENGCQKPEAINHARAVQ